MSAGPARDARREHKARYVLIGGPYAARGGNAASNAARLVCPEIPQAVWDARRQHGRLVPRRLRRPRRAAAPSLRAARGPSSRSATHIHPRLRYHAPRALPRSPRDGRTSQERLLDAWTDEVQATIVYELIARRESRSAARRACCASWPPIEANHRARLEQRMRELGIEIPDERERRHLALAAPAGPLSRRSSG